MRLAEDVAEQLIYSSIRLVQDKARISLPGRMAMRHPKLSSAIRMMQESVQYPVSSAALAEAVGISPRQLERLFRKHIGKSPTKYYMELRLSHARNLLVQTDMTVTNVGLACGFVSSSYFSKCYRSRYHETPYRMRGG